MASRSGDAAAGDAPQVEASASAAGHAPQVEASASPGRGAEGLLSRASSGNLGAVDPLGKAQCDAASAGRLKPTQWMTKEDLTDELGLPACIDHANMRDMVKKNRAEERTARHATRVPTEEPRSPPKAKGGR